MSSCQCTILGMLQSYDRVKHNLRLHQCPSQRQDHGMCHGQLQASGSTAYVKKAALFIRFLKAVTYCWNTEMKKYSTHTCQVPGRDRRSLVRITAIVFGILGLLAYALRCFARLTVAAQQWGISDWFITLAVMVMIPLQVLSIPCMSSQEPGGSVHAWMLRC